MTSKNFASKMEQEKESKQMNGNHAKMANGGGTSTISIETGPPWWRSQRYILAYLVFGGMMNVFFQRINLSIGIICMVNHTAIGSHGRALPDNFQSSHDNHSHDSLSLDRNQSLFSSLVDANFHDNSSISFHDSEHTDLMIFHKNDSGYHDTSYTLSPISGLAAENMPLYRHGGGEGDKGVSSTVKDMFQNDSGAAEQGTSRCSAGHLTSQEKKEDGPFVWDKELQGILLGAVYWTYLIVQVPGNHLVRKFKKKTVAFFSMAVMTAMTMLIHVAALWSPWAVFVVKLVQGGCTALAVISMYGMWEKWAPPSERTSLISLGVSGQMLGNVIVFPVSGLLCKYGFLGGWPSVFYVFGFIGLVWLALFFFFSDESPSTHRYITAKEKLYIISSLPQNPVIKHPKIPWKAILTSPPFWGIVCAQVSFTWGLFLFMSTLPQYMYEVLKFDIQSNGIFTMLPYLALLFTTQVAGRLSDFIIKRNLLRIVWTRKMCIIIANMIPAVLLGAMSFLDCSQSDLVITLLTLGVSATGFSLSGFLVSPYDIGPRFATVMMTISNSLATIPGFVTPYLVAAMTKDQSREQWQAVFFLTSGVYVLGTLGFCFLASGDVQPWAVEEKSDVVVGIGEEEEGEERKEEEADSMLDRV